MSGTDLYLIMYCKNGYCLNFQVSRTAVEGYTGEGEPPCIVMTLKPNSDETKVPNLTLPVTLTGVRQPNNRIVIKRTAEGKAT